MELLNQTIRRWYELARARGCNPAHPVQLTHMENDTPEARPFILVCSFTEPTFSEVPYNTLWLNMNPGSPAFRSLRRRTSHQTDGEHRGTWEEITDMAQIYTVSQIFRLVVENTADVGLDPADTTIPHATPKVMGVVVLESDQADAVAVSSSHPAMTDNRYPNEHDHPDYPRSKIKISATHYAIVEGNVPNVGDVLYLVRAHPTDRNVYYARWGKLAAEDIDWVSPRLERLIISLPGNSSFMNDNGTMDLIGTAVWSNRTEVDPDGLVWSIQENAIDVTIDPVTGVVTCPKLQFDTDLLVKTKLFDMVFNKWVEAEYLLRIIVKTNTVTLISIEIVGVTEMLPADQTTFGVVGHYSDGTTAALQPDTFASNNADALTLTGFIGVAKRVSQDTVVTLSAVKDGLTDTHDVLIKMFKPLSLTIQGDAVIDEHTSKSYAFYVAYNDGTQEQTTVNTFTCDNAKATITGNSVAAGEVVVDEAAVLSASKMLNGVTVNATKNITLRNVSNPPARIPESLQVTGALLVQEKTVSNYTARVVYSDGSKEDLKAGELTGWQTLVGTISATGSFTAPEVTVDTPNTVTANATVAGYAITGHLDLMVKNEVVIELTNIVITGPSEVNEGSDTVYQADAYFSDGSVRGVQLGEMELWSVTGTSTITAAGSLKAQQVTQDTQVTISLRASIGGIVKTDNHSVTIKDRTALPASLVILGSTTVNEGTTSNYAGQITLTNGSKVTPDTITSWTIKSGSGSIDASGKATWPNAVSTYTSVIELKASHMGQAFTATLNVTVASLNNVVGFELVGPTSILEGKTGTYYMDAIHENGARASYSARTVLKFVSATSAASINGIIVTAKQVSADTVVRLEGSTIADGKEWFATLDVTIKDIPVTPSSIAIAGPSTVTESTSNSTYTCTATMSNSSTKTVNPTWSITNNAGVAGVAISASGILTAPEVTADKVITITASHTEGGVTKTTTKQVTITNVVAPAQGKAKFGIITNVSGIPAFNAAFLASLTQELTGTVLDRIYMPPKSSTMANNKFGYVALPKAKFGYAYVQAITSANGKPGFVATGGIYGFAGSWDGTHNFPDEWDIWAPWEGTIDGVEYVIYRNDFPFEDVDYTYEFRYHAVDKMSGNP